MKRNLIIILLFVPLILGANNKFVDENRLKSDIIKSLSDFSRYILADFDENYCCPIKNNTSIKFGLIPFAGVSPF